MQNRAADINGAGDTRVAGMLNVNLPSLTRNPPADKATLRALNQATTAARLQSMRQGGGVPMTKGDTPIGGFNSDDALNAVQNAPGFKQVGDYATGIGDTIHTALSAQLLPAQKVVANIAEANWRAAQRAAAEASAAGATAVVDLTEDDE